jgi:5-hydroxyisourate hydrolase-like protein (transthyretin family)
VRINLYNILGSQINTLYDGFAAAGDHELILDASKLSSGVYFVNFSAGDYQKAIKISLLK